jgi:hypothetical protein
MKTRFVFALIAAMLFAAGNRPAQGPSGDKSEHGRWYETKWGRSYRPASGFIPDRDTAIRVAKAILIPVYGEKTVDSEEPLSVALDGDVWTVKGAVRPYPSGNAEIKLSKSEGTVLFLSHSQ